MIDALPPPLVPDEVDLRDFGFMPLDVRTLLTSSLWIKAKKDPRVAHAAVSLWCECWHQVPAASLPDDDEVLAEFARCTDKEWERIRDRALMHFVKCSDGRLYHRHVATKAIEAWEQRGEFREAKANKETRQQRWRERLRELSQQLRDRGIAPPAGASLETLKRLLDASTYASTGQEAASTSVSTVDKHEIGKTGTGTGTGTTEKEESAQSVPRPLRAPNDSRTDNPQDAEAGADPPPAGQSPTQAGAVCKAMRAAGLDQTNPGDPRLLALLTQGASEAEFVGLAGEAARGGKGFAWVLVALQNRRAEAAAIALAPPVAKPGEVSGRLPEFVPPAALTAEEKASADAARKAAMNRLGRVAS